MLVHEHFLHNQNSFFWGWGGGGVINMVDDSTLWDSGTTK